MKCDEKKIRRFTEEIIDWVLSETDCNPRIKNMKALKSGIASRLRWLWLDAPRPKLGETGE